MDDLRSLSACPCMLLEAMNEHTSLCSLDGVQGLSLSFAIVVADGQLNEASSVLATNQFQGAYGDSVGNLAYRFLSLIF